MTDLAASRETRAGWYAPLAGRELFVLTLVLVAGLALRIAGLVLSQADLTYDEAQYWYWGQHLAFGYYNKPPGVAWTIRVASEICGNGEICTRLPAPLLHFGAAYILFFLGRRLYSAEVGLFGALLYFLMPGVSVSSLLMTTDAVLLFFWAAALPLLWLQIERPRLAVAVPLGIVIGLGLLAKYAMVYLPLLAVAHALLTPARRRFLSAPSTYVALAIALAILAPNILWNASNGFATFLHTGDDIGWSNGLSLKPLGALSFLGGQAGLMGPVAFIALLYALVRGWRSDRPEADRFLIVLSVPIVALITIQGFIAQTHGNWAATAYPAACVLLAAILVRNARPALAAALAVNAGLALVVVAGAAAAETPFVQKLYAQNKRVVGWPELAGELAKVAAQNNLRIVAADGKPLVSQLVYYLRDSGLDIRGFHPKAPYPADHFQMTVPWRVGDRGPVLYVPPAGTIDPSIPPAKLTKIGEIPSLIYLARDGKLPVYRIDP